LVLLVIALARPQLGTERVRDVSRGIAIEMVIDRSSSMGGKLDGRRNRLDMAKKVFEEFVQGDGGDLPGRPSDLIGIVAFARYADTICPLTLAHDALPAFLPTIKLVEQEGEDGTAIGDAVALAAARLRTAEQALRREKEAGADYEIKSKIIILLTDGENNAGKRTVQEAADLAAQWGIKIYAIGVGGGSTSTMQTPFGSFSIPFGRSSVDEDALKTLAETSGGLYRLAQDSDALRSVYQEIDQLEKSEIESTRYVDYQEVFGPFALGGLGLVALEAVLLATWLRRIP
jgi:Ca-activated chloride channel family protein